MASRLCSTAIAPPRRPAKRRAAPRADPMTDTPATATEAPPDRPAAVPLRKQLRRLATQLGPARMATTILFLLVAVFVARMSWQLPLAGDAERALYDSRATLMAPHVSQDPRIVMVTYNDETLFNTGIRSPLDRTLLT